MAFTSSIALGSLLLSKEEIERSKIEEKELSIREDDVDSTIFLTADEAVEKIGFGIFHVLLILYGGLLWLSAGFLIYLFSILPEILKCQWGLLPFEEALLSSLTFVGILVGSQVWGIMADMYGRVRVLILVSFMNAAFSVSAAFAPYFIWMVILRVLGGFSVSASDIIITYMVELLPQRYRGGSVLGLEVFFATGGIIVVAIGLGMVPSVGWSWYLFVSAMPALLCAVLSIFLPPSPRFLVVKGRREEAMKVFQKIAKMNCKPPLRGHLVTDLYKQKHTKTSTASASDGAMYRSGKSEEDGQSESVWLLSEQKNDVTASQRSASSTPGGGQKPKSWLVIAPLFKQGMWRTTLLLMLIWLVSSMVTYGILLMATSLFVNHQHCNGGSGMPVLDVCNDLTIEDYTYVMWTLAAEIPGLLVTAILLPFLGRRVVMAIQMFLSAGFFAFLYFCWSRTALTVFIFCSRAMLSGVYQTLYIYTPEVYPTSVRALGLCICTATAYLGGAISPYILQVLVEANDLAGISVILGLLILTAIGSALLPIETKGKSLSDVEERGKKAK